MAYKPEDFPVFTSPDFDILLSGWTAKLQLYLRNVANVLGIENRSELRVYREILYEIFTRIEKRRVYFHVYYNGTEMGEINEGALLCFWILKLMPFHVKNIPTSLLNTKVAYTVFVNLLHYVARKRNKGINVKSKLMNDLLYAFQYRDLSKEAIMALVDSYLY